MNTNLSHLCDNLNIHINAPQVRSLDSCQIHPHLQVRPCFGALFSFYESWLNKFSVDTKLEKYLCFSHLKCKDCIHYYPPYCALRIARPTPYFTPQTGIQILTLCSLFMGKVGMQVYDSVLWGEVLISVKLSTLGVRSHLCPRPPCSFGLPGSLSICEANKASPSMLADALDRNFYPKAGPVSVK